MPRKRRSFLGTLLILFFISVACMAFIYIGTKVVAIPGRALELYGMPSRSLDLLDHYRLSFQMIAQENSLLSPVDPAGKEKIHSIEIGESITSILNNLENSGLISDQEALRNYLVYSGLDTQLQAGRFILSPAMTAIEIVNVMMDATPQIIEFIILPGWRVEEIAGSLATSGLSISSEEFILATFSRYEKFLYYEDIPVGVSIEGFLPPGSYFLDRNINVEELLMVFLQAFEEQITMEMLEAFNRQGLNLHQAVTLASVVERESIIDEEQPVIASVFLNRLAVGMALESDPTVQYALGYNQDQNTWWTNPLYYEHLQIDSFYNTYRYPGLMPAPIANPTLSSLQAVGFPAQTSYYFFRASCDNSGRHNFSATYEEHLAFGCP